ncbi:TIGR03621 family F420-dependent LLM class oxidoreductase [Promicromonospora sukumoe]|uniref:TIGR03621 family F420-dependent LLM class oxidoreductase n=1 Tax=Promicromonospora sukumoe TaxID=88382 RepID=UPI0037C5BC29
MSSHSPFRFGATVTHIESRATLQEQARRLEGEGWSTLLMRDHVGAPSMFAPLMSAAAATVDLRVGTLVANNGLHHPVRLAQEAATVDLLVDGRLELGLGAGWNRSESDLLGIAHEASPQRVTRLHNSIATMKSAWAGDLRLPAADGTEGERAVLPGVQRPHIPLLIGGHGDAILALAAQQADIVGLNGLTVAGSTAKPTGVGYDAIADRVQFLRAHAGERMNVIELSTLALVTSIDGDTESTVRDVASGLQIAPTVVHDSPLVLVGSTSEVVDKLVAVREQLGISYIVVRDTAMHEMGPVVAELAGT